MRGHSSHLAQMHTHHPHGEFQTKRSEPGFEPGFDTKKSQLTSELLKTSGNRKLSNAQSSWRLFCKGVPVSSNLFMLLNSRSSSESFDFSFLILWASSITIYLQVNFLKTDLSRMIISYDVIQTSQLPGMRVSRMNVFCKMQKYTIRTLFIIGLSLW